MTAILNMTKPKLILHIGTNKTGTTAIQRALTSKRELLKGKGILYPTSGSTGEAHHEISWHTGFSQGPTPALSSSFEDLCKNLKKEIYDANTEVAILSSEYLMLNGKIELIKQALEPFDVTVLVYFRRHDLWWQSVYVQAVKSVRKPPWSRGYQGYLALMSRQIKSVYGKYRWLADRWAEAFGPNQLIVRPYEAAQNGDNLLFDMLNAINCNQAKTIFTEKLEAENKSIGFQNLCLVDIFQRSQLNEPVQRFLVQQAIKGGEKNSTLGFLASPTSRLAQITPHIPEYQYIAQKYMNRKDGLLFIDPLPNIEENWTEPKHPTAMWVVEQMAKFLSKADESVLASLSKPMIAHAHAVTDQKGPTKRE